MSRIYLDWAATAVPDREVILNAAEASLHTFGNPSSLHNSGKDADKLLESSRQMCAEVLGTAVDKLYFTSGGTESNNLIISSFLRKKQPGNLVISGIEHPSVYEPAVLLSRMGWELRIVKPESGGRISPGKFLEKIDKDTRFASCMSVNNETGSIQPLKDIAAGIADLNRQPGFRVHFHADAVQAVCKIPFSMDIPGLHSASVSSHKFQGPRGCGILYLSKSLEPLYTGGGQENDIRHGTENLQGILATAEAAKKYHGMIQDNTAAALKNKKLLIERISNIKGAKFLPQSDTEKLLNPELFSPYILSVSLKPIPGEIMVRVMSDRGFDISTGSACSNKKKKNYRVMEAMGVESSDSFSSIRISTGPSTKTEEITQFCNILEQESSILINNLG